MDCRAAEKDVVSQRLPAVAVYEHVYHLGIGRLLVLPLLWLPLFLLLIGMALAEPEQGEAFVISALALTAILLPFVFITWQSPGIDGRRHRPSSARLHGAEHVVEPGAPVARA